MKIKNIQQYRSIYKKEVRKMPDRNENFIGNFYSDNSSTPTISPLAIKLLPELNFEIV